MSSNYHNGVNHYYGTKNADEEPNVYLRANKGQILNIEGASFTTLGTTVTSLNVTDATVSTSKITGCLITAGGIGCGDGIHSNTYHAIATTESSAVNNGAIISNGGIGCAKQLTVNNVSIVANTASTTTGTGSLVNAGGFGNAGAIQTDTLVANNVTDSTTTSTGSITTLGGIGVAKQLTALNTKLTATTTSTNTTTGSLINAGGFGNAGTANIGGITKVLDTTTSSSVSTGCLVASGGVGVAEKLNVGGITSITDTTDSTSVSTGCLVLSGGAGIAKNVSASNFISDSTTILTSISDVTLTVSSKCNQIFIGSTNQNVILPDVTTLTLGRKFCIINQSSAIITIKTSTSSTLTTVAATSSIELVCVRIVGNTTASWTFTPQLSEAGTTITLPSTTASSSTTTGCLVLGGGIGVGGAIQSDTLKTNNVTDSTTTATGSIITLGGIGIAKNATAANFINDSTSTVTSASPVSLTVTSKYYQVFTGSTAQTVLLPDVTTLTLGRRFCIINQSSATVSVQTSAGTAITSVYTNNINEFTCLLLTGTTAASWVYGMQSAGGGLITGGGTAFSAIGNITANAFITSLTSTVTSASPVTLNASSTALQIFTGSTAQTVLLPAVYIGRKYCIINQSSATLSIQSSGGNAITSVPAGYQVDFTCVLSTGTTAASWTYAPMTYTSGTTTAITATTTSTTTTTGSLINGGGFGNAGTANIGGITKVWDTTEASSVSTGSLQTLGGLGVTKRIYTTDLTCTNSIIGKSIFCEMTVSTGSIPNATDTNPFVVGASKAFTCASGGFTEASGVITISEAGNYLFHYHIQPASTTRWYIYTLRTGTGEQACSNSNDYNGYDEITATGIKIVSAGQTFTPLVQQQSGGSLNVSTAYIRICKIVA